PPRHDPLPHRPRHEQVRPAHDARRRRRPRPGADGVVARQPLDHRARDRPPEGEPRDGCGGEDDRDRRGRGRARGEAGEDRGTGDDLWVRTRSLEVDSTGFPTMDTLARVSTSTGSVATVTRPTGRLDVHGIAAARGAVWIADNTGGYLYRVPTR